MKAVKEEVRSLLKRLPDDCTLEDIQYHLYVIEKYVTTHPPYVTLSEAKGL